MGGRAWYREIQDEHEVDGEADQGTRGRDNDFEYEARRKLKKADKMSVPLTNVQTANHRACRLDHGGSTSNLAGKRGKPKGYSTTRQ